MRSAPVQSFGRRTEPEKPDPVVVLPPVQMPPVQVPVVLVVDVASLQAASAEITRMVSEAVRAGFADAVADHDPEMADELRGVQLDPHAGVDSAQAAEL